MLGRFQPKLSLEQWKNSPANEKITIKFFDVYRTYKTQQQKQQQNFTNNLIKNWAEELNGATKSQTQLSERAHTHTHWKDIFQTRTSKWTTGTWKKCLTSLIREI